MGHDARIIEMLGQVLVEVQSTNRRLDRLEELAEQEIIMAQNDNDALLAELNRSKTITTGILALVQGLVDQVAAANAGQNPAVTAALAGFTANDDLMAAAILANTPAAPAGPVVPTAPPAVTP